MENLVFTSSDHKSEKSLFESGIVDKKELARKFSISVSFVNKLMAEEGLPYFKLGKVVRFRKKEVQTWLSQRRFP